MSIDELKYNAFSRYGDYKEEAEECKKYGRYEEALSFLEMAEEQKQIYNILAEYEELKHEVATNRPGYWGEYG